MCITSSVFSPDGKIFASGTWEYNIKIWNLVSGTQINELKGHSGFVVSLAFSPDGKILASGSRDKTIKIWNVENGTQIKELRE